MRLINRLKQQLAHELPETANNDFSRDWGGKPYGLIRYLAGDPTIAGRSLNYWRTTASQTIGTGISPYTKDLAGHVFRIESQMLEIEETISAYLKNPEFERYIKAMNEIGLSQNVQAIWLTRIYPIERFLDPETGRPIVTSRLSKNGKPCTYNRSLAQFKAALGAGTVENSSGIRQPIGKQKESKKWQGRRSTNKRRNDNRTQIASGCRFCREAFFLWSLNRIETERCDAPLAAKLIEKRNALKENDRNIYQRSANLQGYTIRLLFRGLTKREI
ncbi:MAG: hypothetical protein HC827_15455 [Cyanobacteria bacterium RM1_2_2]|nr:hypothetical protein [Cyanobacteria bacterium RM1_2_2]